MKLILDFVKLYIFNTVESIFGVSTEPGVGNLMEEVIRHRTWLVCQVAHLGMREIDLMSFRAGD